MFRTLMSSIAAFLLVTALYAEDGDPAPVPPKKEGSARFETHPVADMQLVPKIRKKLEPLHFPIGKPVAGDWLYSNREKGQTFKQYLAMAPVLPAKTRYVIYIQPLGKFDEDQRRLLDKTCEYVGIFFSLPVKVLDCKDLDPPCDCRRKNPSCGNEQVLTAYIMEKVLRSAMPQDAFAYIGITTIDLWPGQDRDFVFGQASLRERVGIFSIYRYGNPSGNEAEFRNCMLRSFKVSTHELGHMFTMKHCISFKCNMGGRSSMDEIDRNPSYLCPECVLKISYATGTPVPDLYRRLAEFCRDNGLEDEFKFYNRSLDALGEDPVPEKNQPAPPAEDSPKISPPEEKTKDPEGNNDRPDDGKVENDDKQ